MPSLWSRVASLPLTIEDYALERLQRDVSSDFTRVSTTIRLRGGGTDGIGEDVSYDAEDQDALQRAGAVQPLSGTWTLESFCAHLRTLELWPEPAAHDLALRQAGKPLHAVLEREPRPVRFVVSLRLGEPPTLAPLKARLDQYPDLQFKLDPTNEWTPELIEQVAATGAVESLDLKGRYVGSIVDVEADPRQYRLLLDAFPDAWLEDPHADPRVEALITPVQERVTWDAIIHGIDDITALARQPHMVNVKPSRVGGVKSVLDTYDYCDEHGIAMYGGGQFELGCGRGQIQYLASLFHPDGPNDVAPGGYNDPDPPSGLPSSPLPALTQDTGFRWGDDA